MKTYFTYKYIIGYIFWVLVLSNLTIQAHAQTCATNCLSIFSISMIDLGTSIRGTVKLIDESGASGGARSAAVHALWTRPDGSTFMQYARIGTRLRAEFTIGTGGIAGPYMLEIVDVIKAGYTFDSSVGADLSASINVGDLLNQLPVSVLNSDTTSGIVPLTVNYNSAGSFDPDSSPLTYTWNFGDGSSSSQPNPSHTYQVSGSFTATLTVTDSMGASTISSTTINVSEPTTVVDAATGCNINCIYVDEYKIDYKAKTDTIKGVVRLNDENGDPISDAQVKAEWTLPDGSTVTQTSSINSKYKARFKLPANSAGTYTLTVVSVNKADYIFDWASSGMLSGNFEMEL